MNLEHEFQLAKETLLLDKAIQKAKQYEIDLDVVDIPEFMKPLSERNVTRASNYLAMLKNYNKVDETLLNLI